MTSLLFIYINIAYVYYDDSHHSLTAYYVLGTLPIALYTWWYLFVKQLCKALSFLIYRVGKGFRAIICFKSPSCSNWRLWDPESPWSLGYTPRSLCGFITKPGMDLGSILWVQDWSGNIVFRAAEAASGKQDRGALSLPLCSFSSEIVQRELNLPDDPSSSVLACS